MSQNECYQDNAVLKQRSIAREMIFLQIPVVWKWPVGSVALLGSVLG